MSRSVGGDNAITARPTDEQNTLVPTVNHQHILPSMSKSRHELKEKGKAIKAKMKKLDAKEKNLLLQKREQMKEGRALEQLAKKLAEKKTKLEAMAQL